MDEAEWLGCSDPKPMLEFLRDKASDRKFRLFAVACCRWIWQLFPDERCRRAVEVAEQFADGKASEEELVAARNAASYSPIPGLVAFKAVQASLTVAAYDAVYPAWDTATADFAFSAAAFPPDANPDAVTKEQAAILRDIFGNPFLSMAPGAIWRTPSSVVLATAAYEERILPAGTLDTQRLAVLADALEEAGCDNADILTHLRGPGPHVRGCWAIDLLLGKE
jgi:hypothetical protein